MSQTVPRTPNAFAGVLAVWVVALAATVLIGILVDMDERALWLILVFSALILVSFCVQLAHGVVVGFIFRVSASILGAAVVMGVISLGFWLAAILSL